MEDVEGLLELAVEEEDQETFDEIEPELAELEEKLEKLEFRRMFSGDHDSSDCYIDLQAGSGGTEAQDWTNMLLRMYLRWAEAKGFKAEVIEVSEGEVAVLSRQQFASLVNMRTVGYVLKRAFIVLFVNLRSIQAVVAIRHLLLRSSIQRLMKTSTSTLILPTYALTFTVRQAQVVST